jgi:prepilin-type N-terminal cleavage/methylation domain-containing protein
MPGLCLSSRRFRKRGFSLLEVLVVVGVIALLVSILLPSLVRARDRARGTQCLGNLNQQGVAGFMYAYERGGALPAAANFRNASPIDPTPTFSRIPRNTARILERMVSRASNIYYCPANQSPSSEPSNFEASVTSSSAKPLDAQILYWWLANPSADAAARFLDSDGDGLLVDEYLRKVDARRISDVTISTDQSRQEQPNDDRDPYGWYFDHGSQGTRRYSVDTRGLTAWKNNLYGDGHAAAVRATNVVPRWGPGNRAGW